jgi:hypothetical protein
MMGSAARRQWAGRCRCAVEQRQGTRKVKEGVGEKSGPADARRKQVAQERREKNAWWAEEVSARGNMEFFDFLIYFL